MVQLSKETREQLKQRRKELKLTLQQVAEKSPISVHPSYIGKIENGTANPSVQKFEALKQVLGIQQPKKVYVEKKQEKVVPQQVQQTVVEATNNLNQFKKSFNSMSQILINLLETLKS